MTKITPHKLSRRAFVKTTAAASLAGAVSSCSNGNANKSAGTPVAIVKAPAYDDRLLAAIEDGFELVPPPDVKGKRVLLKPNLVDLPRENRPIVTHPAVIAAAVEAFRKRGAGEVIVGDGPALQRDAMQIVDAIGLTRVLDEHGVPFVDLSTDTLVRRKNAGPFTKEPHLYFAETAAKADLIVSMPKLKTHHWAGVSLSLKNMYGTTSSVAYGWPRNRFHLLRLHPAVLDINLTLKAHYAIVDAVVGLEGDGPILGDPVDVGALVMGKNLAAVDATCARIMTISPARVIYLNYALGAQLGPIDESSITQCGEPIASFAKPFALLPHLAHLHPGASRPANDTTGSPIL